MASKAPERLLTRAELEGYLQLGKKKILELFADPQEWMKPGGTKLIAGEYRLPVSFYNRWLESRDVAQTR